MLDLHCGLKKKPNFREVKKMKHALRHEYKMVSQFIEQNKQKKGTNKVGRPPKKVKQ